MRTGLVVAPRMVGDTRFLVRRTPESRNEKMRQTAPAGGGQSDDSASPNGATPLERPLQARSEAAPALSFQPLNTPKQGLDKRIVAYIQQRIERGELRSGDRLPA